ncbi:HPr kinase/phosphorylase [Marinivivus vitaminiproducens]|uniref:HPr kinase/phosphorylase n=1 Tax=Marinivivus vitaminiproducens TaxID=3035935 RepID=UPI00279E0B49|nr:HPr kinase/phosphatase C-terminal domain-containing protein [Geminicoccaceae bacterium SCSIO 64248]
MPPDLDATARCLVHASCVAIGDHGILLRGRSGSGKSDLALRLIDAGASLVADDQVVLDHEDGAVSARSPAPLAGLLEVRALGIFRFTHREAVQVRLIVDLVQEGDLERLPEARSATVLGIDLPLIRIDGRTASATTRVRCALVRERVA